ncbi:hypothetical protein D3C71_1576780 [compost metagenome]
MEVRRNSWVHFFSSISVSRPAYAITGPTPGFWPSNGMYSTDWSCRRQALDFIQLLAEVKSAQPRSQSTVRPYTSYLIVLGCRNRYSLE